MNAGIVLQVLEPWVITAIGHLYTVYNLCIGIWVSIYMMLRQYSTVLFYFNLVYLENQSIC